MSVIILKWFVQFGFVVIALLLVLTFFPGITLLTTKVTTPFCPAWKIVRDTNLKRREESRARELRAQSSILAHEPDRNLWRTPHGDWWVPSDSDMILPFLLDQQERSIYRPVNAGEVVLDGGAHIGVFTRKALDSGARLVVALEPAPNAAECYRRNFAKEIAAGRVILLEKGIWGFTGDLPLFVNGNGDAANSFVTKFPTAQRVEHIAVISIDEIVRSLNLNSLDMIKVDIKGATEEALRGAKNVLSGMHPRLSISTEDPPEDIVAIMNILRPYGYRFEPGPCEVSKIEIRTNVLYAVPPQGYDAQHR